LKFRIICSSLQKYLLFIRNSLSEEFVCKNASSCCADAGSDDYESTKNHTIQHSYNFSETLVLQPSLSKRHHACNKKLSMIVFWNLTHINLTIQVSTIISLLVILCMYACMYVCMYTSYWGKYCNGLSIAKLNVVKLLTLGTIFFPYLTVYHQPMDDILYRSLQQVYKIFIIQLTISQRLWNLVPFCNNWCHSPYYSLYWLMLGELYFSILQVLANFHHSIIIWIILTCNIQSHKFSVSQTHTISTGISY